MKYLSYLSATGFIIASNLVFTGQVHATIYKCVKGDGKVFYNDKPCASNDAETTLKHEKAPKNPYVPPVPSVTYNSLESQQAQSSSKRLSEIQEEGNNLQISATQDDSNKLNNTSEEENDDRDSEVIHKELSELLGLAPEIKQSPEEQEQNAHYPADENNNGS